MTFFERKTHSGQFNWWQASAYSTLTQSACYVWGEWQHVRRSSQECGNCFGQKSRKCVEFHFLKKVVRGYCKAPYTSVYISLLILAASQHVCMRVWPSNAQNTQQEMLQVVRKLVKAPAMFRAAVQCWNVSPSTHSPATGDTPRTSTKRKKVPKREERTRKTHPTD